MVLQGLENRLCSVGPEEGTLGGGQHDEGSSNGAIVPDEASVKVCKTQETLQLLTGLRNWPGLY